MSLKCVIKSTRARWQGTIKGMNTWQEIENLGFYPELVTRALRRTLGGVEPISYVFQVEAAFDHGSMFNHLNALALTEKENF